MERGNEPRIPPPIDTAAILYLITGVVLFIVFILSIFDLLIISINAIRNIFSKEKIEIDKDDIETSLFDFFGFAIMGAIYVLVPYFIIKHFAPDADVWKLFKELVQALYNDFLYQVLR